MPTRGSSSSGATPPTPRRGHEHCQAGAAPACLRSGPSRLSQQSSRRSAEPAPSGRPAVAAATRGAFRAAPRSGCARAQQERCSGWERGWRRPWRFLGCSQGTELDAYRCPSVEGRTPFCGCFVLSFAAILPAGRPPTIHGVPCRCPTRRDWRGQHWWGRAARPACSTR